MGTVVETASEIAPSFMLPLFLGIFGLALLVLFIVVYCMCRNKTKVLTIKKPETSIKPAENDLSSPDPMEGPTSSAKKTFHLRRRLPVQTTDPLPDTIRSGGIQSSKPLPAETGDSISPGDVALGIVCQIVWCVACYFICKRCFRTKK